MRRSTRGRLYGQRRHAFAAPGGGPYHRPVRYRILVTDLDGTLLDRRGQVSPANLAAIRRLQDRGVEVIPATGRSLPECAHVLDAIGHRGHAITAGGSLVHDAADGSVVLRRTLSPALVEGLAGILADHGHLAHLLQDHTAAGVDYVMVGDQPFDPATEWWFGHLPVQYRRVPSIAHHDELGHTVRVGTIALGRVLGPVADAVRTAFGPSVAVQHWSALTAEAAIGSETHLLETFDRSANKWTAIEDLCARLGVDPRETVAVGDGLNDLEMVREAGLGIAMANADPRIAALAAERAGHHDADGFAAAADLVLSRL
jgi:hydroxymethylpyrimidine pyrophosphatase-like HAD family hydrolase